MLLTSHQKNILMRLTEWKEWKKSSTNCFILCSTSSTLRRIIHISNRINIFFFASQKNTSWDSEFRMNEVKNLLSLVLLSNNNLSSEISFLSSLWLEVSFLCSALWPSERWEKFYLYKILNFMLNLILFNWEFKKYYKNLSALLHTTQQFHNSMKNR